MKAGGSSSACIVITDWLIRWSELPTTCAYVHWHQPPGLLVSPNVC